MTAQDCKRAVEVEIPAAEVEREYSRIAQDLQKRARIPGFRPGKAPVSLVRRRYEGHIREEVLESMVPAYLRTALERENFSPVSRPAIEELKFPAGEAIRFKARFEVLPEFELGDYRSLRIPPPEAPTEAPEARVDRVLEQLREGEAKLEETSDTAAADGLTVIADLERRQVVSREVGSGEAAAAEPRATRDVEIAVGGEDTRPEFSNALRGAAVGDTRQAVVHYPDEEAPELAGKTFEFQIAVKALKRKHLPELDDEFARRHQHDSLAAMRTSLRERGDEWMAQHLRAEARNRAAEELLKLHEFVPPESMVEQQTQILLERQARELARQGVPAEQLRALDWSRARARQREQAEKEVRLSILLDRIADAERIQAPEAELEEEVAAVARRSGQPAAAERRRMEKSGALDAARAGLRRSRVLDWMLAEPADRERIASGGPAAPPPAPSSSPDAPAAPAAE